MSSSNPPVPVNKNYVNSFNETRDWRIKTISRQLISKMLTIGLVRNSENLSRSVLFQFSIGLDKGLLLLIQVARHFNLQSHIMITITVAIHFFHPLA